jgi:hypothetical protein
MIDGEKGQAMRQRHTFAEGSANNQPADQPRARRGRHGMEARIADAGFPHDFGDQVGQMLQMRPRGDFRHYAAEGRVFLLLTEYCLGQDAAIRAQHRSCGFIAAALYTKDGGIQPHARGVTTPKVKDKPRQNRYRSGAGGVLSQTCGQLLIHFDQKADIGRLAFHFPQHRLSDIQHADLCFLRQLVGGVTD